MPQRVKDRAEALRLSGHGWYVEKIAAYLNWAPQTVRETIHRWNSFGLGGLWEAQGRGGKPRGQEADIAYLEQCLEQEPPTYNSQQLAQKLERDRQVKLSSDRIRRVLKKKRGMIWKRTCQSYKTKQEPQQRQIKQADY